jgi:hypothetical protein
MACPVEMSRGGGATRLNEADHLKAAVSPTRSCAL